MPRPAKDWAKRHAPTPWTAEEDRTLLELSDLGVGLHQHVVDAVLPGRTVGEAIERRFALRHE